MLRSLKSTMANDMVDRELSEEDMKILYCEWHANLGLSLKSLKQIHCSMCKIKYDDDNCDTEPQCFAKIDDEYLCQSCVYETLVQKDLMDYLYKCIAQKGFRMHSKRFSKKNTEYFLIVIICCDKCGLEIYGPSMQWNNFDLCDRCVCDVADNFEVPCVFCNDQTHEKLGV